MIRKIYEYREMLFNLVKRDLRSRYKASVLGFLWTFINPLMQLAIYSFVFPYLMRVTEKNYTMFLFVALLPWNAFVSSLQISSTCIVSNSDMVKKIYFPREILPLSVVCTNMVNYLYCMAIVVIVLPITGIGYSWNLLWYPLVFLIEFIVIYAFCLMLSAINVMYRDIEHIVGILTMAWFYATPILYNMDILPASVLTAYKCNPMVGIILAYRDILFYKRMPDCQLLTYDLILGIVLLFCGLKVFKKSSRKFGEEL